MGRRRAHDEDIAPPSTPPPPSPQTRTGRPATAVSIRSRRSPTTSGGRRPRPGPVRPGAATAGEPPLPRRRGRGGYIVGRRTAKVTTRTGRSECRARIRYLVQQRPGGPVAPEADRDPADRRPRLRMVAAGSDRDGNRCRVKEPVRLRRHRHQPDSAVVAGTDDDGRWPARRQPGRSGLGHRPGRTPTRSTRPRPGCSAERRGRFGRVGAGPIRGPAVRSRGRCRRRRRWASPAGPPAPRHVVEVRARELAGQRDGARPSPARDKPTMTVTAGPRRRVGEAALRLGDLLGVHVVVEDAWRRP